MRPVKTIKLSEFSSSTFQLSSLRSVMETTYSTAKVCLKPDECLALSPGPGCVLSSSCARSLAVHVIRAVRYDWTKTINDLSIVLGGKIKFSYF